jgi:hypothetical protein
MAANGIVREALGDLDGRLDHWKQTPSTTHSRACRGGSAAALEAP